MVLEGKYMPSPEGSWMCTSGPISMAEQVLARTADNASGASRLRWPLHHCKMACLGRVLSDLIATETLDQAAQLWAAYRAGRSPLWEAAQQHAQAKQGLFGSNGLQAGH